MTSFPLVLHVHRSSAHRGQGNGATSPQHKRPGTTSQGQGATSARLPDRSDRRILAFLHDAGPGDAERAAMSFLSLWQAMGAQVSLFLSRVDRTNTIGTAAPPFAVSHPPDYGSAFPQTLWSIFWLARHIRSFGPDILFCAGRRYIPIAIAMKLVLGRNCPAIVARISESFERPGRSRLARLAARLSTRFQARFIDQWVVTDAALLPSVRSALGPVPCTVIPDPFAPPASSATDTRTSPE